MRGVFMNLKEPEAANYSFLQDSYFRQDVKVNPLWNVFPPYFYKQYLKIEMIISNSFFVWVVEEENFFMSSKYTLLHMVLLGRLNT